MATSVFERYPRLVSLKGLVPDEVVEREIGYRADEFDRTLQLARLRIPTVRLNQLFPAELERGAVHLENFLGHWGNASVEEVCKICLIVRWLRPSRVLEIGTYNGLTTLQMALNAPRDCPLYTLDLPEDAQASVQLSGIDRYLATRFRGRFDARVGSYFAGRPDLNVVQLWGDSAVFDYARAIDGRVDLVFIDAAHDYVNKSIDTKNALNLLSPKGVVLWHNYADPCNPDVTRYLLDLSKDYPIFHLKNSLLAAYWQGYGA
ncbi:MAG: class I SAM-dependent methyltransferase [Acidobacteria bacterium]|nr:class I SAM-dependent methyltransferase [Acidobacteriota bacterium]